MLPSPLIYIQGHTPLVFRNVNMYCTWLRSYLRNASRVFDDILAQLLAIESLTKKTWNLLQTSETWPLESPHLSARPMTNRTTRVTESVAPFEQAEKELVLGPRQYVKRVRR